MRIRIIKILTCTITLFSKFAASHRLVIQIIYTVFRICTYILVTIISEVIITVLFAFISRMFCGVFCLLKLKQSLWNFNMFQYIAIETRERFWFNWFRLVSSQNLSNYTAAILMTTKLFQNADNLRLTKQRPVDHCNGHKRATWNQFELQLQLKNSFGPGENNLKMHRQISFSCYFT